MLAVYYLSKKYNLVFLIVFIITFIIIFIFYYYCKEGYAHLDPIQVFNDDFVIKYIGPKCSEASSAQI